MPVRYCAVNSEDVLRRCARWIVGSLWLAGVALGCAAPARNLTESPLSVDQQQQAVLQVVPLGTPRGEAEQRLQAAGIAYSPGTKDSIYYLTLWDRADGQRWHINVALLFDQAGRLYLTRPGDTPTAVSPDGSNPGSPRETQADRGGVWSPATATAAATGDSDERVPFPGQSNGSAGQKR